ncbi:MULTISPECIES: DUF975 family protein [Breznakia]|uniref:Uncharacterized protein DUF975 n=1 Tax=Breznakia blatticola TaxID=1754012 RepID=A0A4R7ZR47_9FIRM|nr:MULTISPECIES: DUF975 family protein [Breznakia]MDH6367514.1 putative membrane protein [Breznakia sp. PH1-1]MDH6404634.1 putative membrane protein [Breznakia sp. PF1-11]MDH6412343.1 putative membrane protein [Breznakia sp. PFB1-11]MDH6414681.1 putative membrane protein [Breznakia sp. PFB1-14]MDH6416924.1 putative membrane protein [Breznakia sp. PFB1-4]
MFNRQLAKVRAKNILHRNILFLGALAAIPIIFNFVANFFTPTFSMGASATYESLTQSQANLVVKAYFNSLLVTIPVSFLISTVVAFFNYFLMLSAGYLSKHTASDAVPFSSLASFGGFINFVLKVFVKNVIIALGYILLVVPGIYLTFRFYLVEQIAVDQPELGIGETLTESGILSKGSKLNFFVLDLSFILWEMLALVSYGISNLYVLPYKTLTQFDVYEQLKSKLYPDQDYSQNANDNQQDDFVNTVEF